MKRIPVFALVVVGPVRRRVQLRFRVGRRVRAAPTVEVASSPEKVELLTKLAGEFNDSSAAKSGGCVTVHVHAKSSGVGATALVNGWRDTEVEGPQPVIWTPSSSLWGGVVNQRRAGNGEPAIVPATGQSFMNTPLVIAMPKPMAAGAWAGPTRRSATPTSSSWRRTRTAGRARAIPSGARSGSARPTSTSRPAALAATTAQYYAATGKVRDLTLEDLDRPDVQAFSRSVESTVVHYGDTTLTFLNNWFRNDAARHVAHLRVGGRRRGEVGHRLQPRQPRRHHPGRVRVPRPPKVPLVAIYPKEGTLFSDNPFFVLDAPWVTPHSATARGRFADFVRRARQPAPGAAHRVPARQPGGRGRRHRSRADNGLDPNQPQTTLGVPPAPVLVKVIDQWAQLRKGARVLLVIDVSGSMGDDAGNDDTKLELAKQAAIDALDQFKDDDLVGLRVFTTERVPSRAAATTSTWSRSARSAASARCCARRSAPSRRARARRSTQRPRRPTRACSRASTRRGSTPSCC